MMLPVVYSCLLALSAVTLGDAVHLRGKGHGVKANSTNSTVVQRASMQGLRLVIEDLKNGQTPTVGDLGPAHKHVAKSDPLGAKPAWVDNPLAEYFFAYTQGPLIWKWHHYFHVYHKIFQRFRGKPVTMIAIGVQSGGEIGMWQNYFGPGLTFVGVDINPACKSLEQIYPGVQIITGDQGDPALLAQLAWPVDIIIDDGSHINSHQIKTFETLYPYVNPTGMYVVEDMVTSYSPPGAGHHVGSSAGFPAVYDPAETFVTHMKNRVDFVNGYWNNGFAEGQAATDPFVSTVDSITFYDGVVVTEKRGHPQPTQERRGTLEIPYCTPGQADGQC